MVKIFTNPTPAVFDLFGWSVAALGSERVIIGAFLDDTVAFDAGAAYLFHTNGTLLTTFTNLSPTHGGAFFGESVAAVGVDRVLIGAESDDIGAPNAGVAYLFNTNGALLNTFTNPSPQTNDQFGRSVAVVGTDGLLIGALSAVAGVTNVGKAHLFNTNGTLLTTFTNPHPNTNDHFGYSLAATGNDRVLIGTPHLDTNAYAPGAAYLFSTNGTLLTVFSKPAPESGDRFGFSLAAVGSDRVLISALGRNATNQPANAAYLFTTNGDLLTPLRTRCLGATSNSASQSQRWAMNACSSVLSQPIQLTSSAPTGLYCRQLPILFPNPSLVLESQ